jgi:hypothetical protein
MGCPLVACQPCVSARQSRVTSNRQSDPDGRNDIGIACQQHMLTWVALGCHPVTRSTHSPGEHLQEAVCQRLACCCRAAVAYKGQHTHSPLLLLLLCRACGAAAGASSSSLVCRWWAGGSSRGPCRLCQGCGGGGC